MGRLVVTRGEGERVRLTLPDGRHVWLTIYDLSAGRRKIRLAVDAPPDVLVLREEIIPNAERTEATDG